MTSATTTVRRTVALAAAAALTGGALVAGAGAATADTVTDVSGVVTNAAGAPLADADVAAYVQVGTRFYFVDFAETDATGRYNLTNLDAATRASRYPGTNPGDAERRAATTFKLEFSKNTPTAEYRSNPGYLTRSFGGTKTTANSTPVGLGNLAANQSLPSAAGMVVRVTGATGAPVSDGFASVYAADAVDPLDALAGSGSTSDDDASYNNPATPAVEAAPVDGLVYVNGLEPGSYVVSVGGSDDSTPTTPFRSYISRFIGGNGTYAKAASVTTTGGAFATTGAQLSDVLTAIESPRIIGNSTKGTTLKADPGTWLLQQGTEFTYQWTRNGAAIAGATGPTYKITKADKKKKIGVIVYAVTAGDGFFGSVAAAPTSKVGEKSKVKAKADGFAFDVTVSVAQKGKAKKVGKIKGKVVLLTEDGEVASKKAKLKAGKVDDLAPKRQFLGEKKFVVQYLGGGKLGSDTATAKLGGGKGGKGKKS